MGNYQIKKVFGKKKFEVWLSHNTVGPSESSPISPKNLE
jgi:hypothetical protein